MKMAKHCCVEASARARLPVGRVLSLAQGRSACELHTHGRARAHRGGWAQLLVALPRTAHCRGDASGEESARKYSTGERKDDGELELGLIDREEGWQEEQRTANLQSRTAPRDERKPGGDEARDAEDG